MTLKTWLSAGHGAPHKHSKAPVDILPAHDAAAPKLPAHRGLTTLPNGDVTLRRGLRNPFSTLMKGGTREWRVRSVEDVLEAEGGDYGFLEYYSLRRTSSRDTALTDPRAALSYGTWSHLNSAWARWPDAAPAQFYPGTLGRADKDQRRLSEHRHPRSYHLEEPWRPEDMRTSTPLSSTTSSTHDGPPAPLAHQQSQQDAPQEGPQEGGRREGNRRGVVKRNSLLWRLRPERWRTDGSLRRARSRDDGLAAARERRKGDLGASQPDLLTSHRAPDDGGQCDVVSPAPLSILPPTTRRAAQSETLPRKIRHNSKDAHAAHTLLARGRRWLHSASLGRADRNTDRGESEIMVQPETLPTRPALDDADHQNSDKNNNNTNNNTGLPLSARKMNAKNRLVAAEVYGSLGRGGVEAEWWRQGRDRSRRPRTFYLLEDYLSPVRAAGGVAPAGVVLDEYVGRAPRLVFRETSHEAPQRPVPPTPEWDTPSLSPPPSSVLSGQQPTPAPPTAHQHPALPGGRSLFVDAIIPSPEKSCGSSVYSPVFSPRDSGYPRFVTPELALPELSVPERAPPPVTGLPAPPHCHYSHSHSLANNPRSLELDERKRTKESRKVGACAGDGVEMPSFLTSACCIFGIHLPFRCFYLQRPNFHGKGKELIYWRLSLRVSLYALYEKKKKEKMNSIIHRKMITRKVGK